jgi:hypothetical protein
MELMQYGSPCRIVYFRNSAMIECPKCKHENPQDSQVCAYCQSTLDPLRRTPRQNVARGLFTSQPQWGNTRLSGEHRLRLRVMGTGRSIEVKLDSERPTILGRFDPKTGLLPDVDLRMYNGAALGVSRMHAQLTMCNQMVWLMDLGSTNRTFINGKPLDGNQSCMLRDGDEIQLGGLKLHVLFVDAASKSDPPRDSSAFDACV